MIDKALAYVIQSIPEQAHRPSPVLQDLYLLDVFVNINSFKVTPDIRNHNDSKQIRHTIKIPDMRAFYIEPAGFQAFE